MTERLVEVTLYNVPKIRYTQLQVQIVFQKCTLRPGQGYHPCLRKVPYPAPLAFRALDPYHPQAGTSFSFPTPSF